MAEQSAISWCDSTFNPVVGCSKVSPACDNCYAEAWAKRSGLVKWGNNPRRRTSAAKWKEPFKWQRQADEFFEKHGRDRFVFGGSLCDPFDNKWGAQWRTDYMEVIDATDRLVWILLTKRPQNIKRFQPEFWDRIKDRIIIGITAENQEYLLQRWPVLAAVDVGRRMISYEPALGAIDLEEAILAGPGGRHRDDDLLHSHHPLPDWLIAGGESGPRARPPQAEWFRDARSQCKYFGIPFHFKQWGGRTPNAGGHLLDGEAIQEFPDG